MNLFETLLKVADALEREKVDYILIGGFAVILYGLPRLTQDLDLFINNKKDNVQRLKNALNQVFQDQSIEEITVEELDRYPVIRYGSPDGFTLDFVVKIGEMFTFVDLSYEVLDIEGHRIKVATPECLLRMKEGTMRPIDQNDAIFLREFIKRRG
jgi:hypothetical protein